MASFNRETYIRGLGKRGTVVANGTTEVTVADTNVKAASQILLTLKTAGGTVGNPYTFTKTPGVGFSIKSQASDTSTYDYAIVG